MTLLTWILGAVAAAAALAIADRLTRVARVRAHVLEEVRRVLRDGVIERAPGHGLQARGRMGQLEISVDLHSDRKRAPQSPMWRVLAVGPVRVEQAIEVRAGGWQGWIDPWMQLARRRMVRGAGPELEAHSEVEAPLEHPVIVALGRQGPQLAPGALYARPDLMRAEVRFAASLEENRGLFAYLHAMAEISESTTNRLYERRAPLPRIDVGRAAARREGAPSHGRR